MPQWLLYQLNETKRICKFAFRPRFSFTHLDPSDPTNNRTRVDTDCPQDYTFEGSNDNITFDVLGSFTNQPWCEFETLVVHSVKNDNSYKFYKLNVTEVPGRKLTAWTQRDKFVVIGDVRFYGEETCNSTETQSVSRE